MSCSRSTGASIARVCPEFAGKPLALPGDCQSLTFRKIVGLWDEGRFTLTLTLREREQPAHARGNSIAVDSSTARRQFLPLPRERVGVMGNVTFAASGPH